MAKLAEVPDKYKISGEEYISKSILLADKYGKREWLKMIYWILDGSDPFYGTVIGLERLHCVLSLSYLFREYIKPDCDWSDSHELMTRECEKNNVLTIWHCAKNRGLISKYSKQDPAMKEYFHNFYGKQIMPITHYNKNERMFLMYRGWFKTTLFSVAHTLQELLLNPEDKILIISGTMPNAESIIGAIKGNLMFNERIRMIFPEYCPAFNKAGKMEFGTKSEFTLPNRKSYDCREPSVQGASIGSTLVGLHFRKHIYDDLINENNVTTGEQIEKAKQTYQLCQNLYENNANPVKDILGTHYHELDLYMDLKRQNANEDGFYKYVRYNPITKQLEKCKKKVA